MYLFNHLLLKSVTRDEHLCQACWTLASESINLSTLSQPQVGHRQVCVNCGRSLLRIRSHQLRRDNDRESHIFNVIQQWNLLHHVTTSSLICHPCWCRADRAVLNIESMPATRNTLMDIHQNVQSPEVSETTTLDTQIQPSPIRRIHCINCGRALQRSRYHYLSRRNERETRILNVISKWTIPQQVCIE
ncbi:unnamed protein product [Parnassius mnemosyne]|uniref:Uncharacterized protein n=1 Tax=Parnassius mnemosyne TaxID=213953 RepID=A0AAV1LDF5_9NEOP